MIFERPVPITTDIIKTQLTFTLHSNNPQEDIINDILIASVLTEYEEHHTSDDIIKILLKCREDGFIFNKYNEYTYAIGKLVRLAEIINYEIESIVRIYKKQFSFDEIVDRNSKCRELKTYGTINNFDFMKFARFLSCMINSDKTFDIIDQLNNKEKKKLFSKTLYNFVIDRNYYAHGYLFIQYPDFNPILSVVHKNADHYLLLNNKILTDYRRAFLYLETIIRKINQVCSGLPVNQ